MRRSLAAWRARADTCDVYYRLETIYTLAGVGKLPWFRSLTEPVCVRTQARLASCGTKRLYSSAGQILSDIGAVNHRRDSVFDGRNTLLTSGGDRQVLAYRGRTEARGVARPTGVVGLDTLCKELLEENETSPDQIAVYSRDNGRLEIDLHWSSLRHEYLVDGAHPYVIHSFRVYDGDELLSEVSGIRYHEFPGGVLYPVEGTRTDYERGTGELAEQVTFKVDTERTRIDPPGGIPDEVFSVTIPEEAELVDGDTGRPVSAEEKEIFLVPHRLRERKIELPTSRPAEPASTRPSRS